MAAAAPGRFVLGLGASSPVIVGNWNGIDFDEPYRRSRDVLRIVQAALAGERVDGEFDTFTVKRFKLEQAPAAAAAGAARRAASADAAAGRTRGRRRDPELAGRRPTSPQCLDAIGNPTPRSWPGSSSARPRTPSTRATSAGMLISTYLTVPAYAAFHDWLGRGDALRPMHEAWAAGDRKGAAAAIPDEVVDELVLHGSPERVPRAGAGLRRRRRHDAGHRAAAHARSRPNRRPRARRRSADSARSAA